MSDVEQWTDALGDWSDDDPDVLTWPWDDKQPVVADVDGQLKQFHNGLLYPAEMDTDDLETIIEIAGEPDVSPLSAESGRFDKEMFEWVFDDE